MQVVVSAGWDDQVRTWRLEDGSSVTAVDAASRGVLSLALGALSDGTQVIVLLGRDDTVQIRRLSDLTLVGEPLRSSAEDAATERRAPGSVAVSTLPDGTLVVISSSSYFLAHPTARATAAWTVDVRRLDDGAPVGRPLTGFGFGMVPVSAARLADGTPVLLLGDIGRAEVHRLENRDHLATVRCSGSGFGSPSVAPTILDGAV